MTVGGVLQLCFVQTNGSLSYVEEYKMLGFVGDKGSEITANDAVPGGPVLLVEEGLDVLRDVLLLRVRLQCRRYYSECVMLHFSMHTMVVHCREVSI